MGGCQLDRKWVVGRLVGWRHTGRLRYAFYQVGIDRGMGGLGLGHSVCHNIG